MNTEMLQVVQEKDPWIVEEGVVSSQHEKSWITLDEDSPPPIDKKGRRKSWHAIKFDRKRRKGVVEPGTPTEARPRRPSWWNIFANQQWPR